MLALSITLIIAAVAAGLFLRAKPKTIVITGLTSLIVGDALHLISGGAVPAVVCFFTGALVSTVLFLILEKRGIVDGILFLCIEACIYALWSVFREGLAPSVSEEIVLFLYGLLYIIHVPAMLLSFEFLRLSEDWLVKTNGVYRKLVPITGAATALMLAAVMFLDFSGVLMAAARIIVSAFVFWGGIIIMTLLVSVGHGKEHTLAQDAYHDDMNTFMNVVRSQRHDYNLHVQTVASLIAQEKWDECREYVNALTADTNKMNAVLPVKDPAVAALINNFRIIMAQNGITLLMDIRDDMANVVTTAYETNKIIGNLLQNALDELAGRGEQGSIELDIFKRGEYVIARVSNPVADPEAFRKKQDEIFRQGFTTKRGHDGVGLSSIKALAESKGGGVTCWLEDDIVHFTASIPVRLELNEE